MSFNEEINLESLINALVRLVIEFLILFVVYFWVLGTNTNLQNSWLFFAVSFVLIISVVPVQVQFELIRKHATNWRKCFDKDEEVAYSFECDEAKQSTAAPSNIWKSAFQLTLPGSLLGAGSVIIFHYYFKQVIWLEIVLIGFVAVTIIVPLVLYLNKRCLFPICYFLSSGRAESTQIKQSIDDYFFYHHILPWLPITLLTSGLLAYKMTEETLFSNNSLGLLTTAMYAASTSYVTLLWMWYESKSQTKVEQKMRLFDHQKAGKVTSDEFWFVLHCVAIGVLLLSLAIGYLFFSEGFPQWFTVIYIIIVGMSAGAFGNILGVISSSANIELIDQPSP